MGKVKEVILRNLSFVIGGLLFLLTADCLSLKIGGFYFKDAYFLLLVLIVVFLGDVIVEVKNNFEITLKFLIPIVLFAALNVFISYSSKISFVGFVQLAFNLVGSFSVFVILKMAKYDSERLQRMFGVVVLAISTFGLIQFFSVNFFGLILFDPQFHFGFYRINGLSWYPNFYNIYLFMLIPFWFFKEKFDLFDVLILLVLTFVIFQSTARVGWVLSVILVLASFRFLDRNKAIKRMALIALFSFTSALVPSRNFYREGNLEPGSDKIKKFTKDLDTSFNSSGSERIIIAQQGVRVWKDFPFLGVGLKNYSTFIMSSPKIQWRYYLNAWTKKLYQHHENIWLEVLTEIGVLGFVIFQMYLIYMFFKIFLLKTFFSNVTIFVLLSYFYVGGQFVQNFLITLPYILFAFGFVNVSKKVSIGGESSL